ncbi:DUF6733 family protein [uncultured Lacinutrix sp.]|uniref:DUF6733 family protein n=1 Tax=uncultured Lacinutrix sp. TaxID=574032 RepID=UPI0026193A74|nr:DUF6733 family protein [uncultured Lacinutrix sp.]
MKKVSIILLLCFVQTVFAQELKEKQSKKTSFVIMPIHNSVAGFSNVFLGNYELDKKKNLTFYSVFWNNPSFGGNTGSDLFLETGIGLGFKLNNWYINPTLGFGHGKFMSNSTETTIGEAIIPNVLVLYNSEHFELDFYLSYYKALREGNGDNGDQTRDLLLNWVAPGYKLNKYFSFGAYYESFTQVRTHDGNGEDHIYQWLGGYVKATTNNGIWFRFAAGPNLGTDLGTSKEFYKIQAFIPIN